MRARITIGSLLIAALLLAAALIVVRVQVATILSDADSALAQDDLVAFANDIVANPTAEVDNPGTGVLVYVRNPTSSVQVNTLPHDIDAIIAGRPAATEQFPFTDDEGRDFVVVGRQIHTSAGTWALWSARSTSSSELALEGLDRILLLGGIVLLIGFGAASWVLATIALRPVAQMRRKADALGTTLDGDLPVGAADDELTALATTLNGLLARLRAASARERQMVSDAAHELRTPLAALTTQLELAHRDEGDAPALLGHLAGAERSAARLSSLANNLLELNRLEVEHPIRSSTTTELVTELMEAIDRARMLALRKSVDVAFEVTGDQDDGRWAIDAQSFGRVLDNLLGNAVHAVGDEGEVAVQLAVHAHHLDLTVVDDGPGMPAEFLPRAFERFSRPDSARTTADGGSGLGLALVAAIVESSRGTIELRNTAPGLTVQVRLPQM